MTSKKTKHMNSATGICNHRCLLLMYWSIH